MILHKSPMQRVKRCTTGRERSADRSQCPRVGVGLMLAIGSDPREQRVHL
jgi:hypothetical protein